MDGVNEAQFGEIVFDKMGVRVTKYKNLNRVCIEVPDGTALEGIVTTIVASFEMGALFHE